MQTLFTLEEFTGGPVDYGFFHFRKLKKSELEEIYPEDRNRPARFEWLLALPFP